ncbi:amidase [Streptomyces sp. AM 4-1-1]|uniref:amidase n=1 Tax=Streptomyces sp. AM 4-1-1 TaxID=3028710 RepID=UPI0023B9DBAF|nr:amidase [Streptomyces sp. AM 4-1-1]WEH37032.1 amidase [Streptomyces sp. AM 4-1-1]
MSPFVTEPLRRAVVAVTSVCLLASLAACADQAPSSSDAAPGRSSRPGAGAPPLAVDLDRVTIVDLQRAMNGEELTSEQLTRAYLERIRRLNPRLGAVVDTNPDAIALARRSDTVRGSKGSRGPLEGIPVLLKENIDTADRQPTTAGSEALSKAEPTKDAFLVQRLRDAGAVILGKTNMSEWANFRSPRAIAGWSGVGGQTHNPYVLDRSPSGSSSGSAVAAAAGLAAVTIGTETDGSIVSPASMTSTVGFKPTLGMVSRSGIVPITERHDSAGPIARNATDAALTLWAIHGSDPADAETARADAELPADYRTMLDRDALRGKRVGVWRKGHTGIDPDVDRVFAATVKRLKDLGATVVEGADVPSSPTMAQEHLVPAVLTEFKHDINAYLAATPGSHPKDLAGLIAYNKQHARTEMALFGQELFEMAEKTDGDLSDPVHRQHRETATRTARQAIDGTLAKYRLDAIITPTELPAPAVDYQGGATPFTSSSQNSAVAGYPHVTVPGGYAEGALPLGVSFLGTRFSDARLLSYAYALEQVTPARTSPRYLSTLPSR